MPNLTPKQKYQKIRPSVDIRNLDLKGLDPILRFNLESSQHWYRADKPGQPTNQSSKPENNVLEKTRKENMSGDITVGG